MNLRRKIAASAVLGSIFGVFGLASFGLNEASPEGWVEKRVAVDGKSIRIMWMDSTPSGAGKGTIWLAHGFARSCMNLGGLASAWAQGQFNVACVEESMAGGAGKMAEALAKGIASNTLGEGGGRQGSLLVAGHSAGWHFALAMGAAWEKDRAPWSGAIVFDPVGGAGFDEMVGTAGASKPIVSMASMASNPAACNAKGLAEKTLSRLAKGYVGVKLGEGSTHAEVEGAQSQRWAAWVCGGALPNPTLYKGVHALAVDLANAMGKGNSVGGLAKSWRPPSD